MDERGQANIVATASVGAIVGVVGIIIFAAVYDGLNTSQVSTSATSLLDLIDLVLAAVLILAVLGLLVFRTR